MNDKIIQALLLPVWGILAVASLNAQIASSDRQQTDFQTTSKYEVNWVEEELEERIDRGDLLLPEGISAYDTYTLYAESHPAEDHLNRKLKRTLVAALADAADKALTGYFDEGGAFILKYILAPAQSGGQKNEPLDLYYFVAADLLGEGHFLNGSLKSKGFFIEALKLRYVENKASEAVKAKLNQSLALDPMASYTYNELGLIWFEEGNYPLACDNFNRAIELNTYWVTPQENLELAQKALIGSQKND